MDPNQQIQPPPVQNPVNKISENNTPRKRSNIFKILGIFLLFFITATGVYYFNSKNNSPIPTSKPESLKNISQNQSITNSYKQWINCDDIRNVLEADNKLYVACLGGVLIYDITTNKIIDQISTTKGLGNATTTNLIKKGNILYIGTQDGFTKYDLNTKIAKKISVEEGLPNGANIYLADDNDYIWVGTFDGLSKYNTATGEIVNYKTELADNSTGFEVSKVLVTPNAVYLIILANAYSQGGVARYDKPTKTWERFGPSSFGVTGQYPRIDLIGLDEAQGKVYVGDYSNFGAIWESEDKQTTTWKPLKLQDKLQTKTSDMIRIEGHNGDNLLFTIAKNLYAYDISTGNITKIDASVMNTSVTWSINQDKNKLWFKNIKENGWLTSLDIVNNKETDFKLNDRPNVFNGILAVLDGIPLINADNSLWKYDSNNKFTKFNTFKNLGAEFFAGIFKPIPGSENIFIYNQFCGEGCSEPIFTLYNYLQNTAKDIPLSEEIAAKIKDPKFNTYQGLSYSGFDTKTGEFTFNILNEKAILDINSSLWQLINTPSATGSPIISENKDILCNASYEFTSNKNKFKEIECPKTAENNDYTWTVERSDGKATLWQMNKKTSEKIQLSIPYIKADYSPFQHDDFKTLGKISYLENRLWVMTNRGLGIYNPSASSWKMLSTKEGLLSNEIDNFVVDGIKVWVLSHWGGLSVINY